MIKWHIGVECIDNPIAVRPDTAIVIKMKAVRIGIPGRVEPIVRPMFTEIL